MITHVGFGLNFVQVGFGKAAGANQDNMLEIEALFPQAPKSLPKNKALEGQEEKAEQEEDAENE